MEEDDTLELSIDPFAEVPMEETLQAAKKRSPKALPLERMQVQQRLQTASVQKRSSQVGEEDVLASKPLAEGRKKSPALQEKSKQSSPPKALAAQKRLPKALPLERLQEHERLQAQKRSPQLGEEDIQASKPLAEGRKKYPALQEKS